MMRHTNYNHKEQNCSWTDVHPSEYAELLEDESFVDNIEVNDRNKENFIIFAEYFFQQDINWLFGLGSDSKTNFVKTYLELITGGVISKLAEKLLDEEERQIYSRRRIQTPYLMTLTSLTIPK